MDSLPSDSDNNISEISTDYEEVHDICKGINTSKSYKGTSYYGTQTIFTTALSVVLLMTQYPKHYLSDVESHRAQYLAPFSL